MGTLIQAELIRQLSADVTLAETTRALQDLFGLMGTVLLRDRRGAVEVFPSPGARQLNPHCAVVRSTPEGLKRCAACQTSLALRAPYDGMSQHSCHSAACILAIPARGSRPKVADMLVVTSGAFVREQHQRETIYKNLLALGIPRERAKRACEAMPVLTDREVDKVKRFLSIASIVVGRTLESLLHKMNIGRVPANGVPTPGGINQALQAVFSYSGDLEESSASPGTGNRIVDAIVQVVARTPEMHFTLDNLAQAAGMSANHLSTLFHRHYGTCFSEFLVEQRVKAAMRRLHDPLQSIEDVARLSGFNNVSYFCRCFKERTGTTPGQWRRRKLGVSRYDEPSGSEASSAGATPVL